jgi:hypothetical protein
MISRTMVRVRTRNDLVARRMLALGAVLLVVGCGRTDLDLGGGATADVDNGGQPGAAGQSGTGGQSGNQSGAGGRLADAGVGAGGGRGGNAGAPGGAGAGGAPAPTLVPCGMMTCAPRAPVCCLQRMNGRTTQACVASQAACASGMSLACVDASGCGRGQFCCATVIGVSTMCTDAATCARQPGVLICNAATDCPATSPNCCRVGATVGICTATACPGRGG